MSSTYTGNPAAVDSPSPAPNLSGNYPIATLPADGDSLAAASVGQEARLGPNWVAYLMERYRDQIFGDGSDGVKVVNSGGNSNITSMQYFSTVSVSFGQLRTNGWPIIARTSISVTGSGSISGTGGDAGNNPRGLAQAGLGLDGPHIHLSPGAGVATAQQYIGASIYGFGGNGGKGGGSVTGSNTVISAGTAYRQYPYRFCAGGFGLGAQPLNNAPLTGIQFDSIRGGAAGNPGDPISGVNGGGGGAGGALVVLMAPSITINASILSNGGSGGAPGSGVAWNGGGGGGGGAFLFICQTINVTGATYSATGGAVGFSSGGTGTGAAAGSAGNTTPYIVYVP